MTCTISRHDTDGTEWDGMGDIMVTNIEPFKHILHNKHKMQNWGQSGKLPTPKMAYSALNNSPQDLCTREVVPRGGGEGGGQYLLHTAITYG